MIDWTFGTEELSGYSKYIHQVEKTPRIVMHPKDMSRLGLPSGGRLRYHPRENSYPFGLWTVIAPA